MATINPIDTNTQALVCYECLRETPIGELLGVDDEIESLPPEQFAAVGGYFSHCGGGPDLFHANPKLGATSLVNICKECLSGCLSDRIKSNGG